MSWPLFKNSFTSRRPRVVNVADTIKIETTFIKTTFKDSKGMLKELKIMY